ncbi:hypothetical protein M8C21_017585, partial [Ambrosia artemisiifolia]
GPLHKIKPSLSISFHKEDTSCITWLDKQPTKSVVYISFGSLATMDAKVLTEIAWGLMKSDQRFLWAVRPGLVSGSEWLELLPEGFIEKTKERGLIVKWAPQKDVLAHFAVGAFWSHCGWNSCLESISLGVVMICQPFDVDQWVNARYVSFIWKIGIELEQVPVFAVGPLHKITPGLSISSHKEDTSCIAWLDKQPPKSVVYISFGSLATMDVKVLTEMAWGLMKSDQRFLWAVRPGLVSGLEWLELLPKSFIEETRERGLIVKWAPQKDVLAHFAVGGFWSHCGWNSCLENQGVNTRYVSYVWKIGIELEQVERGEIERMIRRVMVDDEGEEMRVRVNDMKEMVKEAVENRGSSQESLEGLMDFILSR